MNTIQAAEDPKLTIIRGIAMGNAALRRSSICLRSFDEVYKDRQKMYKIKGDSVSVKLELCTLSEDLTGVDDYSLLKEGKYVTGNTLNYYRCLLLSQDWERRKRYNDMWEPSWIYSPHFVTRLLQEQLLSKDGSDGSGYNYQHVRSEGTKCTGEYVFGEK